MNSVLRQNGIEDLIGYLRNPVNLDLYLVNTSDIGGRKRRTEVIFNVEDSSGRSVSINLRDTFIPVNVGTKVDKLSSFSRSDSFLNMVSMKYVTAVDADAARKYLLTPEATEELNRIMDTSANDLDGFNLDDDSIRIDKTSRKNQIDANPKVVAILLNQTLDESKKLSALRNVQSEIRQKDVAFIMQNATDERIKTWAQSVRFGATV